jgi:hypothetical protein
MVLTRDRLAALPVALLATMVAVSAIVGANAPAEWYPYGLLAIGVLVVVLAARAARRPARVQVVGLAAASALAGWSYLSIGWAGMPGTSLISANRSAVYAAALATVVLTTRTASGRRALIELVGASAAAVAWWAVARSAGPGAASLYDWARLTWPVGSPNALCALLATGLWPLLQCVATRERSLAARALALLGALPVPIAILLTVSRAGALFAVVGLAVLLAAAPRRLRTITAAAITSLPLALAFSHVHSLYRLPEATDAAANTMARFALGAIAAGAVVGLAWIIADRRLELGAGTRRVLRRTGIVAACLLALAAAAVAVERDAAGFLAERWTVFTAGQAAEQATGADRYLTAGTNRYDFWRVAVDDLRDRPLTGYGAGNWSWRYIARRHSDEMPDNAHGTIWEVAADLGLPGLAMLLALAGAAATGVTRMLRGPERATGAALAASLAGGLGHAQVDWLWELFGVGLALILLVGAGVAGAATDTKEEPLPRSSGRVSLALALVVALVGIAPALLAERLTDQAYTAPTESARSAAGLAATLDPISARPEMALAWVELRAGRPAAALAASTRATEREPKAWSAWRLRAQAATAAGAPAAVASSCAVVRSINPGAACP